MALSVVDALGPTPIRSPAGHARPLEETDRWLAPLLNRVPITRVYDATPLDVLGLPVWGAVTPLARDLTVHAGKGRSALAARVSAVMEAIERVCAERVDAARLLKRSFAELRGAGALDPKLFDLPFETGYEPGLPISWIRGYDLLQRQDAWVPLDLVISPAGAGVCRGVETNGLAAGNNHTEAVVHALHEVVERDAAAHAQFASIYGDEARVRLIDPATLPRAVAEQVEALAGRGVSVMIENLSHDVGVPVFRATIADRGFPGREGTASRFEGLGADLDPEWALARAIAEAAQAHTAVLLGARDSFEGGGRRDAPRGPAALVRRLLARSSKEAFPAGDREPPGDVYERLLILLERLARVGFRHCVVVDLTREELGVPVVRVLVPGAAAPYGESRRRPALRLLRTVV